MASRRDRRASRRNHHIGLVGAAVAPILILPLVHAGATIESQWALERLKAPSVWKLTRGADVKVAVIDTGVSPGVDLVVNNNLLEGADFSDTSGTSIGNGLTDTDLFGHGTGEAALIAGLGGGIIGLAPEAIIVPLKASDGTKASWPYGTAPAVKYAVSHGCRVINLAYALDLERADAHHEIENALRHDVVVVAAVGNDGTSRQYFPAAWPGVVGVGAIDRSGKVWERSNTGPDVDLVAPGVHILRDDNRGRIGYSDGTSEATAYVSAAAALVRSAHPGWSAKEVVAALVGTADKPAEMRGAVRDDRYGAGILNVLAAVSLTRPPAEGDAGAGRSGNGGKGGVDRSLWWWGAGVAGLGGGAVIAVLAMARRKRRGSDQG